MAEIELVLSEILYNCGIIRYISLNTDTSPHIAVSGITDTGKTYLVKLILARISRYITDSHITVCDFKGDSDFSFLNGCDRFFRFDECMNGFIRFYESFINRQRNNDSNSFQLLIFDEWASFLNHLDKKDAEEVKKNYPRYSCLLALSTTIYFCHNKNFFQKILVNREIILIVLLH